MDISTTSLFKHESLTEKVLAEFDSRSVGGRAKASGVADLTTQLSLGASITLPAFHPAGVSVIKETIHPFLF